MNAKRYKMKYEISYYDKNAKMPNRSQFTNKKNADHWYRLLIMQGIKKDEVKYFKIIPLIYT
uniref:Uncharacterized protein n=1 Tax=viral metagenome TaxID=1070528 RepID=A0A6H1ZAE6_9ZZZZ